jgi:hypothetical protein
MLVISSSFFASGLSNDSKGSGGGDSSAVIENVNKFEVTKVKIKLKAIKRYLSVGMKVVIRTVKTNLIF